jgi:hypothetical protein
MRALRPETVQHWQRDLVHHLWVAKQQAQGRLSLPTDAGNLLIQLAHENAP